MIKNLLKISTILTSLYLVPAYAQNFPSNSISNGPVAYTTPNQWQSYSYTFTATTTGPNYIGFAFRQVPAFWTFTNVDVYTTNAANNLIYNGNMASGGQVPSTGLQAPTGWGVWYQTGTPPGAAGSWQNGSNPSGTGGVWYDGAVQSYDGIYQAFNAVAGTTYTVTFQLEGDNATSSPGIAVGVYAGACSSGTTIFNCGPSGFSILATPAQTAGAVTPGVAPPPGNPTSGPTLVTSVTGNTPVPASTIDTTAATTVNNGTIRADQATQTLSQNIQISNVSVVDQNGNQIVLSGTISGSGSLTIANTGTGGSVTLTNTNTYTGATTINQGARLINQGSIASSSGVTNNGTFTNSGTAPNVTNNGTFTNSGTAGNLINNATATNTGLLGTVTNNANGNFTNGVGGITGVVTNSGILINAGRMASLNNSGTATNSGTIIGAIVNSYRFTNTSTGRTGALTNTSAGTVNNSGTVGAVQNAGIFNNLLSGITGLFTNTGTLTNRDTLAALNNNTNGTVNNYGTITGVINNNAGSTFTNYSDGFFNAFNNSGNATNEGTIRGGIIVNDGNGIVINNGSIIDTVVTNNATATNNGTMGDITNNGLLIVAATGNTGNINNSNTGTVNFTGTGTVGAITNAGTTNISGTGTASSIVNTGTVNMTGGATLANVDNRSWFNILTNRVLINSVTNSGNFNISGAGGDVEVTTHIQTPTGNLIMAGDQKYNITGTGTLDGTLTINNSPTAFGRYTFITAQSILGTFTALSLNPDISPLGAYLKYSAADVKLYVTPSGVATQQGIDNVANDTNNMNRLVSGKIAGALSNDCVDTGELAGCVSMSLGRTKTTSGNLTAGTMTVGFGLVNNMRMGVFLDKSFANPSIGSVRYNPSIPLMGGYIGWSENGFNVVASAAKQKGQYTINRPLLENAEAGTGIANTTGMAYQIKTSYTMPLLKDFSVTPYAGIRQTRMNIGAYTETGNVFPLSINQYSQTTTDLLGGLSIGYHITNNLTASISGGVVKNIAYRAGSIDGSSEIQNMFTFINPLPGKKYLSGSLGAGLVYEFTPGQKIGVNVGWQQRSLLDASVGSIGLTYSLGF